MKLGNPLRFIRPFSGLVQPDLVTVLVESEKGGATWSASFIGDGRLPSNSRAYSDMDELVRAVDEEVRAMYPLAAGSIGFQYAWYPWGDDQKALKTPGGPKEFLMFEVRQSVGGYQAWLLNDPGVTVTVSSLRDLPEAIRAQVEQRWPSLAGHGIPGMIHWNRNLTPSGFVDVPTLAS
jgi:hypothetical protein